MTTAARRVAKGKRAAKPGTAHSRRVHEKKMPRSRFLALEDDLKAIGMSIPAEEWQKLPRDFNENLDHYLYGSPKKKPVRG
jgi:hypothetical protein